MFRNDTRAMDAHVPATLPCLVSLALLRKGPCMLHTIDVTRTAWASRPLHSRYNDEEKDIRLCLHSELKESEDEPACFLAIETYC